MRTITQCCDRRKEGKCVLQPAKLASLLSNSKGMRTERISSAFSKLVFLFYIQRRRRNFACVCVFARVKRQIPDQSIWITQRCNFWRTAVEMIEYIVLCGKIVFFIIGFVLFGSRRRKSCTTVRWKREKDQQTDQQGS